MILKICCPKGFCVGSLTFLMYVYPCVAAFVAILGAPHVGLGAFVRSFPLSEFQLRAVCVALCALFVPTQFMVSAPAATEVQRRNTQRAVELTFKLWLFVVCPIALLNNIRHMQTCGVLPVRFWIMWITNASLVGWHFVLKKELKCHVVTNILWVTLPFLTARPNVQTLSENINALHVTTGVTWMLIAVLLRGSLTGHVAVSLAAGVR